MKKILIPIFNDADLWAVMHGSQLVERIKGKIYILECINETNEEEAIKPSMGAGKTKDLVNNKTKEGNYVHIKMKGNFLTTCIDFIIQEKIDLLVLSIPTDLSHLKKVIDLIKKVKARRLCNVELVKK